MDLPSDTALQTLSHYKPMKMSAWQLIEKNSLNTGTGIGESIVKR